MATQFTIVGSGTTYLFYNTTTCAIEGISL